jgi:hypothetical protein
MSSLNGQKLMWHLWDVDDVDLTVIGFYKETQTVHQILMGGQNVLMVQITVQMSIHKRKRSKSF